ncbi:sodium-dependent phosphate transport protein 2A-like [Ptychodera flava]|uniref:sodium-dependent phosphate transport protein 2A-like n=1 Tax=Ptychodera flava TaxID=63121 RepID=UPI00396AA014
MRKITIMMPKQSLVPTQCIQLMPEILKTICESLSTPKFEERKTFAKKPKKGVSWTPNQSEPPSRASSTTGSPQSYRRFKYAPIPSQASSVASSAPPSTTTSAASSAYPSRATSMTDLDTLDELLERDKELEPELEIVRWLDLAIPRPYDSDEASIDTVLSEKGVPVTRATPPAINFTEAVRVDDSVITPLPIRLDAGASPSAEQVVIVDETIRGEEEKHVKDDDSSHSGNQAGEEICEAAGATGEVAQGDSDGQRNGEEGDCEEEEEEREGEDPWSLAPDFTGSDQPKWSELSSSGKTKRVLVDWFGRAFGVLFCIYFFIVALSLMGDAFTLIGGSAAGAALSDSTLLENAVVGLMIGMLVTVLLQSSSATTSIIVSMVASDIIDVPEAIPMVMGANLGTSVTNTIVAGGQAGDRDTFRRAFAGATVHDCFNWLAVLVLLPIESLTGYLYHLTTAMVEASNLQQIAGIDRIKISDPITDLIIQLDLDVLERVALGELKPGEESLVDRWCVTEEYYYNETTYDANGTLFNYTEVHNYTEYIERCKFLFAYCDLADEIIGTILLLLSLVLLMSCLIGIVKILSSILKSSAANTTKKFLNTNFPGYLSWLTGYVAMLIGAIFTMLLQSSSVFTSLLTPLVGLGIITVERMYPLTLGANIGTTFTSLIAAFASSDSVNFVEGVQISFCHLFFNLTGILLYYPIPITRKPAINGAKFLGKTTAEYRWFSLAYVLTVFLIVPFIVLLLAMAGWQYLAVATIITGTILIFIITLNILQNKCPRCLPRKLRTWDFLPEFMHTLKPYDRLISKCMIGCRSCRGSCRRKCTCFGKCGGVNINDEQAVLEEMHTVDSYVSFQTEISDQEGASDHVITDTEEV